MEEMLNRILNLLKLQNKQQKDLAEFLGVSSKTVSSWVIGQNKAYKKYLYQIAAFLHTTPEYLRGETDDPAPQVSFIGSVSGDVNGNGNAIGGIVMNASDSLSEQDMEMLNQFRLLSVKGKARALVFLMDLVEKEKNEQ